MGQKLSGNVIWSSGKRRRSIIVNGIIDEVRNQQRNLAVAFYDYQKNIWHGKTRLDGKSEPIVRNTTEM